MGAGQSGEKPSDVRETVLTVYRKILKRETIDPNATLEQLGADSHEAVLIVLELEQVLGIELELDSFLDDSDLTAIVSLIEEKVAAR